MQCSREMTLIGDVPNYQLIGVLMKSFGMPNAACEKTIRRLTVSSSFQARAYGEIRVPMIRLRGKWLESAGFAPGNTIEVIVNDGELRLLKSDSPILQSDSNECERRLTEACGEILELLRQEERLDEVAAFSAAQNAWSAYRDAEVSALYPPEFGAHEIAVLRRNDLRAELAQERLRQLRAWWE